MTDESNEPTEADEDEIQIECPRCDGEGHVSTQTDYPAGVLTMDCPECGGTGWC